MDKGKYADLIDDETWAFIERTESWYPPDTVDYSIDQQRDIYDKMCREFFTGYPDGISASDETLDTDAGPIPVRHYAQEQSASSGAPVAQIVFFHGGGFVVGGLESHDDVCAELCAGTGYPVTSVDYALAPEHVWPADFNQALAAFRHLARRTGLPTLVVGDSAGGNLAAAVSHATRGEDVAPVGQVLIYPGLGSDSDGGTFVTHANAPMLTTHDVLFYKTIRTGGRDDVFDNPSCAPLNDTDFSNLPPTFIATAECDPLAGDGERYRDALLADGSRAVWFNEKGLVHGYLRARHSVERARVSFARIIEASAALGRGEWIW